MTDLRTAAQRALEAMLNFPDDISDEMFESITALKAALAEPVQEPVAWVHPTQGHMQRRTETMSSEVVASYGRGGWTPLYAAPPQRKPLTDEEIKRLVSNDMVQFARAIERAHGIGGSDD